MKKPKPRRRKCRHCNQLFNPEHRNLYHQHYCQAPDCRQASKAASQRRWLSQGSNRDYFRGSHQVRRVQEWRKAHPGYWKRKKPPSRRSQIAERQTVNPGQSSCNVLPSSLRTLQDFCLAQEPVFVGLLSMFTGSTLQEDIAATTRKLLDRGRNILGLVLPESRNSQLCFDYDRQTSAPAGSGAPDPHKL